jgi:hypothetical protein
MAKDKEELMKSAKRAIVQGYAAKLPMMIVKAVAEEFGEKGWAVMQKASEQFGKERAQILKEALDIDVNDARSLGKVFDFEDGLSGIVGEWIESSAKRAKKLEKKCSPHYVYNDFPPYCEKILYWIANATIKELNRNAELEDFAKVKCMVHGDDVCEINVEIK